MSCFYCGKDQRLLALMKPLAELEWSDIYLFRDQKHLGRVVVALKAHCDELWQLDRKQRQGFMDEVALAAEAVSRFAKAGKINYAVYGDKVSHFHVHLVPKVENGLQWGVPFTDDIPKVVLPPEEFRAVGQAVLSMMDAVTAECGGQAVRHLM